ncbi:FAD-dependent monooxygenase [Aquimarina sp. 2201CG5-10]|uniref:FAD-dependent monooxygenase n=1 Tax=Aquimarina callyspongiae TaxID=3098150 RepID=UPI002AB3AA0A|nr:FAD-dependent monooxygenase [Aquimarina sp. 2201CG5-10]MDY8138143.1 FAD-dependent monooxygenase [Aquimarina sp. 2201CG5-10]
MIHTDIIIVGNGIAGLVLSFLLKKKRIDHKVLNRASKKANIALAETLPPSAIPLLYNLELLEIFEQNAIRKTYGYHSSWGDTTITDIDFFHQPQYKNGLKINKSKLLKHLAVKCNDHIIEYEKIVNFNISASDVTVEVLTKEKNQVIQGKIIIDATGRNRAILKRLKIPIEQYDNLISYSSHIPKIKHPKLIHDVFIESFKYGWGIVSGLDKNTNMMSIFTNKGNPIQGDLKNFNYWHSILSETLFLKDFLGNQSDINVIGGDANSSKAKYLSGKNFIAIGDAALSFDPLSSHGVTTAIYTAKEASLAIEAYIKNDNNELLGTYSETLSSIFDQYLMSKNMIYMTEKRWPNSFFWKELSRLELETLSS